MSPPQEIEDSPFGGLNLLQLFKRKFKCLQILEHKKKHLTDYVLFFLTIVVHIS